MTAHDPALVERLVQAAEDWLNDTDPFAGLDAYDRERCARMLTGKHLNLLAAEGRLCEPGEVQGVRGALREAVDDQIRINVQRGEARAEALDALAEVHRLRDALARVATALDQDAIRTCSRDCKHAACGGPSAVKDALRVAGEALTVPPVAPLGADGEPVCICTVSQRCSLHADGGGPG